jgi:hypothetical protein
VLLAAALGVGALILIGTYTFVPPILENLIATDLQRSLGLGEKPEVELGSDPAPAMLVGRFDEGKVIFTSLDLGGIHPGEVTLDLNPFNLDLLGSLTSGRVKGEKPISGTIRAELSQKEVARLASSGASSPVTDVDFEEGRVSIGTQAGVLGERQPVRVEGDLSYRDGELRFDPDRVEALGVQVPSWLIWRYAGGAGFSYRPGGLPFGWTLSDVEAHKSRLVLSGKGNLPTG